MKLKRSPVSQSFDEEVDLVPLIDCVFLLLLFFMLCGQLTTQERVEQITVPPATSAKKRVELPENWRHAVINLSPTAEAGHYRIRIGQQFDSLGLSAPEALLQLRTVLDQLHRQCDVLKTTDTCTVAQAVIELRADGDVPWHAVQEVQQVLADCIDPLTGRPTSKIRQAFTHINFSVRDPND